MIRPDVVFPKARVAIFLDGCFWHSCPKHGHLPTVNCAYWTTKLQRNLRRDKRDSTALKHEGWHVVRVWEHADLPRSAKRIASIVRRHKV